MDVREKLVELLDIIIQPGQRTLGDIADYLISNGVTVQEWIPVNERCAYTGITSLVADVNVNEIAEHIRCGNLDSWVQSWQR